MPSKKLVRVNKYETEGLPEYVMTLFPKDFKGVCIDVGAYDPFWISNSWIFEQAGWYAYCIEPNPTCIPRLKEHRKNVIECACGDSNKNDAELFVYQVDSVGEAAGTGLIDHCLDFIDSAFHQKHLSHTVKVRVRTLDWLMENEIKQDHIDYLSIDVESSEIDVLRGTSLEKWKPKIIVVENLENDPNQSSYLINKGYRNIYRIMYNDVYTLNSYYEETLQRTGRAC